MDYLKRHYDKIAAEKKKARKLLWGFRVLYYITSFLMGWTIGGIGFKLAGISTQNWLHVFYPCIFIGIIWGLVALYFGLKEGLK